MFLGILRVWFSDTGNNMCHWFLPSKSIYSDFLFVQFILYFLKDIFLRCLYGAGWLELYLVPSFVDIAVTENLAFTGFFMSLNKQVWS